MRAIKCLLLAVLLLSGCGSVFGQDYSKKSVKELLPLAEQSDAEAQYNLGVRYENGRGVRKNQQKAFWWWRVAAEHEHPQAQYNLGWMYSNGEGVPQDYQQAAKWWRKSANQGNASAQNNLGRMYRDGKGVSQDYQLAVKWFSRAAEQGYARAQYNLGLMHQIGNGVPQDYVLAHKWFNLAAARVHNDVFIKNAPQWRDGLATLMTPSQIAKAQKLAREFKPKKENP